MASIRASESFFKLMLNTNYFVWWLIYGIGYALIALIIGGIYDKFFTTDMKDLRYTNALNQVTLILGFIYTIWITCYLKGYSSLPAKYSELISSIENYAFHFFSSMQIASEKHKEMKSSSSSSEEIKDIVKLMNSTRDVCFYLVSKGYQLFSTEEQDRLLNLSQTVQRITRERRDWEVADIIHEFIGLLILQINILKTKFKMLDSSSKVQLLDSIKKITDIVRDLESSSRVVEPGIFMQVIHTSLIVFFLLWIPYVLVANYGLAASIFIYTITMLMLTSLMFTRTWLKDPFDRTRPVSYMDFYDWRAKSYARITHYFQNSIRSFQNQKLIDENFAIENVWKQLNNISILYVNNRDVKSLITFYQQQFPKDIRGASDDDDIFLTNINENSQDSDMLTSFIFQQPTISEGNGTPITQHSTKLPYDHISTNASSSYQLTNRQSLNNLSQYSKDKTFRDFLGDNNNLTTTTALMQNIAAQMVGTEAVNQLQSDYNY